MIFFNTGQASLGHKFPYFTGPMGNHNFRSFLLLVNTTSHCFNCLSLPPTPALQLNTIFISSDFVLSASQKVCMASLLATMCGPFVNCGRLCVLELRCVTSIISVYRSIFFCAIRIGYRDMPSTYRLRNFSYQRSGLLT